MTSSITVYSVIKQKTEVKLPSYVKCYKKKLVLTNITAFLGAIAEMRKASISFVTSVRPSALNNSAQTGRILMKFISYFVDRASRYNSC
jgi:hypothetical protein